MPTVALCFRADIHHYLTVRLAVLLFRLRTVDREILLDKSTPYHGVLLLISSAAVLLFWYPRYCHRICFIVAYEPSSIRDKPNQYAQSYGPGSCTE